MPAFQPRRDVREEQRPAAAAAEQAAETKAASRSLAADEVSVQFGGLAALDRVSAAITTGEIVGVIGPNGAGKTTLFNVLCGFVRPDSGQLRIDGQPVRRVRPDQLAKLRIARTLQAVSLWSGLTVRENVMAGGYATRRAGTIAALFGLPKSDRSERRLGEAAMDILSSLRIAEFATDYPHSLPYAIQKRVGLARALACDPDLLLLDEPAGGLSEGEIEDLSAVLRTLRERMGILLVEHHMDFVLGICDRVIVLDFGRVIAAGTPAEISADPAVAVAYLGQEASAAGSWPGGSGSARD